MLITLKISLLPFGSTPDQVVLVRPSRLLEGTHVDHLAEPHLAFEPAGNDPAGRPGRLGREHVPDGYRLFSESGTVTRLPLMRTFLKSIPFT